MASLQSSADIVQTDPKHLEASCEFLEAKHLAMNVMLSSNMGCSYHRIVQKCLLYNFGCGTGFDTLHLQEQFFRDVVCELEDLEVSLRSIYLDE